MIREVELLSYLPKFIQEYREMKQIMVTETPEIQVLENETEIIKNNQFILSCDVMGIKRFESLLDICPSTDDTLQTRILRVLARWNNALPYTYRGLKEKLNVICGKGNYQLLPNFDVYTLNLIVCLRLSGQVAELDYLLSYMIPANIHVIVENILHHEIVGNIFLGSATVQTSYCNIISNMHQEHIIQGNIINRTNIATVLERTIH